jgi:hypothetical protein
MLKTFARAVNVLFALCLAPRAGMSTAAQIAASIEYDYVERPRGPPEDFVATSGTSLKLLSIKTIDGFPVQAALWHPVAKRPAETTLIIMIHGVSVPVGHARYTLPRRDDARNVDLEKACARKLSLY